MMELILAAIGGVVFGFFFCVWVMYKSFFKGFFHYVTDEEGTYLVLYMKEDQVVTNHNYILLKRAQD